MDPGWYARTLGTVQQRPDMMPAGGLNMVYSNAAQPSHETLQNPTSGEGPTHLQHLPGAQAQSSRSVGTSTNASDQSVLPQSATEYKPYGNA